MERFLQFEYERHSGLHTYTVRAGDADIPEPLWSGLREQYPDDAQLNPYFRHAINNADGEALAIWRALAWTLTTGTRRLAIPTYYRDGSAATLGRDRSSMCMVRWEYEIDVEQADPVAADRGFVPARACVPMRPAPSQWERERSNLAGLFPLDTFTQLTALDLAVGGDASSEITLFGLSRHDERAQALYEALNRDDRPDLSDILRAGEVFVDLAIVRDRFLGHTSYLTIKTIEPVDTSVQRLAEHYNSAFRNYIDRLDQIRTLPDFHAAIDKMLAPPVREHS